MIELTSPPPIPQQEYQPPLSQVPVSGFRRTAIRDSIRVAKDKPRPSFGTHSYSSPPSETTHETVSGSIIDWTDTGRLSEEAAEPPQIPRIAAHARKRSSTGPRPVPLSAFHSYPGNSTSLGSSFSNQAPTHLAPTSRDKYDRYVPRSRGGLGAERSHDMTPYIESYTPPPPIVPDNFYDPAGTMRMEAFVDRNEMRNAEPLKAKREAKGYRTKHGRKKDLSYWGVEDGGGSSGAPSLPSLRLRGEDPFSGF